MDYYIAKSIQRDSCYGKIRLSNNRESEIKEREIHMSAYIVIDLEMCKVHFNYSEYRRRHEIVQIGAVMLNEAYEVIGDFSTYVSPEYGKIDYFISSLTGITEKDIKNAPRLAEALQSLFLWIGNRDVRFYAWSETDYNQLKGEITEKGLDAEAGLHAEKGYDAKKLACVLDSKNWVDYQKVVNERFKIGRALSLADALTMTDLEPEGRLHDGLADAWNTARMISKLQQDPDFRFPIDKLREEEKKSEPLTTSLASLLQGIVLEPA